MRCIQFKDYELSNGKTLNTKLTVTSTLEQFQNLILFSLCLNL